MQRAAPRDSNRLFCAELHFYPGMPIDPLKYGLGLIDMRIEWDWDARVITVHGKQRAVSAQPESEPVVHDEWRAYPMRYFLVTDSKDNTPCFWVQWKALQTMCTEVMSYKNKSLPSIITSKSV